MMAEKTAAAVLQEMMVKHSLTPKYEDVAQSGPHQSAKFVYRCSGLGESATAVARSMEEAIEESAKALLVELARKGHSVPAPWGMQCAAAAGDAVDKRMGSADENNNEQWRFDMKITEYQFGLVFQFEKERRVQAMEALRTAQAAGQPPSVQLECAAACLGLEPAWGEMPSITGTPLVTVELPNTHPSLFFIDDDKDAVAKLMNDFLEMCLINPRKDPFLEIHEQIELRKQKAAEERKLDAVLENHEQAELRKQEVAEERKLDADKWMN